MLKKTFLLIICLNAAQALASDETSPIIGLIKPQEAFTPQNQVMTSAAKSPRDKLDEAFNVEFWQDEFYRAHSAGMQNLLIFTNNFSLFEDYLNSLIRLCISQNLVKTTFVGPKSDSTDGSVIYRRLRDNIKPNGFILRNFHRWETSQDIPGEIPSQFNREKYSGILLPGPNPNGYRKFRTYLKSVQGILYIPCAWWQKQSVMTQLIQDGFQKKYIMVAQGMIMACSSDPSQFSKSLLYPAHPRPESNLNKIRKYLQLILDINEPHNKQ